MAWLDGGSSRIPARCAGVTPSSDSFTTGGYLRPARSWALPLWNDRATEPLPDLDLVVAGLAHDKKVRIRSIARPISPKVRDSGWAIVEALRAGRETGERGLSRRLGRSLGEALRGSLAFALAGQSYCPRPRDVTRERLVKAGADEAKVRGPHVVLEVHVLVRARNRRRSRRRLRRSAAVLDHGAGPFNRLELRCPMRRGSYLRTIQTARPWRGAGFEASAAEAAAPTVRPLSDFTELAEQSALGSAVVPVVGASPTTQRSSWGRRPVNKRREARTYGLKPTDALKHVFVMGPTGVGKSTFLFWMALSAIGLGRGVLLLDPKGDLACALLASIPPARERDVLSLDFADTDRPVGLNPLDLRDADEGDRVAMAAYSLLRELIRGDDFLWGTSMSQASAYGFRTLAANTQINPTMLDLERLFIDREWRQGLVANVTDPFVLSYWRNQVDRISVRQFKMTFGGALRRMAMPVQDPRVRNIPVQPRSAVRWDGVLERGEIVLAYLDQADTALGAAGSRLLGSILVTQTWQAVLRRPAAARSPFFAVIDEFLEFVGTGRDMGAFFERSRSYGVGLAVATQNPGHRRLQSILTSVLLNTRTHVVFGGLREQTRHFAMEMAPVFTPAQLDDLPAYHMAIKTLVDNRPARPFEAAVGPIPRGDPAMASRIQARARRALGQPRAALDAHVAARYGVLMGSEGSRAGPAIDACTGGSSLDDPPDEAQGRVDLAAQPSDAAPETPDGVPTSGGAPNLLTAATATNVPTKARPSRRVTIRTTPGYSP